MEFTIIGAGAIGGTVGAFLSQAGHDVTAVDVVQEHIDIINREGLRISGIRGDRRYSLRAIHAGDLEGPLHNIILAVKGHFTHSVVSSLIAPRIAESGYVVSFQNGLNESTISQIIGEERTVGALVHFGADYLEPGHIQLGQEQDIFLGELDGSDSPRVRELRSALSSVMPTHVTSNIHGYLWGKLVYGSMAFAVSTVDAPVPEILADPRGQEVALYACCESAAVASTLGYDLQPIGDFEPKAFLPGSYQHHRGIEALNLFRQEMGGSIKQHMGIWRDLKIKQRKTEVDVQCGEVVIHAATLGIDVPVNEEIIRVIHEIEDKKRGMDWGNLDTLRRATTAGTQREL